MRLGARLLASLLIVTLYLPVGVVQADAGDAIAISGLSASETAGVADTAVTVRGVVVSSVNGDFFGLGSKRMIDSRFWGGPLFDGEGRLAGILLTSLAGPKAISTRVIQRLLDQRGVTLGSPAPP